MVKSILQLVRAPNGLTALSNILAASVIASAGQINSSVTILIFASLAFYYGGMALNDCFDYKEDLAERANRPLPSGQIPLKMGWLFGLGLMATGLLLSAHFSWPNLIPFYVGFALAACILLYNSVLKEGLAGSIMMGFCRYFNWLLGASFIVFTFQSNEQALPQSVYLLALPIWFYITGLTFLSKQETQAKNRNALWLTSGLLLATAASLFMLLFYVLGDSIQIKLIGSGLIVVWLILMLKRLVPLWFNFTPDNIQKMIMFMIIGVIPLDALMLAISGYYIWALVILALLPPCRILSKYLYMT